MVFVIQVASEEDGASRWPQQGNGGAPHVPLAGAPNLRPLHTAHPSHGPGGRRRASLRPRHATRRSGWSPCHATAPPAPLNPAPPRRRDPAALQVEPAQARPGGAQRGPARASHSGSGHCGSGLRPRLGQLDSEGGRRFRVTTPSHWHRRSLPLPLSGQGLRRESRAWGSLTSGLEGQRAVPPFAGVHPSLHAVTQSQHADEFQWP